MFSADAALSSCLFEKVKSNRTPSQIHELDPA